MFVPGLTPVQRRMLELLSDGQPHSREELHGCLWDEMSRVATVRKHICLMRRALRPVGHEILCEYRNRRFFYRHIVLLTSCTCTPPCNSDTPTRPG